MFFGHRQNLILPGRSTHMGDGWETRRRRGPGHDWTIVRLAARGALERVELDTDHFKGNAPGHCDLDGATPRCRRRRARRRARRGVRSSRTRRCSRMRAMPGICRAAIAATHVRLNIHPDGGVARLRLFGAVQG
jgi:allantoicase